MTILLAQFSTLAYRPFLDPIELPYAWQWLLFLIPISAAIAIVYKTLKTDDLRKLPRQASRLTATIILFMVIAAIALYFIVDFL